MSNDPEVLSLVSVFRAKVVDISHTGMIIEASGNKEKVEAFIELLRPLGIRDFTRTGCIAIGRIGKRVAAIWKSTAQKTPPISNAVQATRSP